MAVEVDAEARPVEARRDLLDMGRLAGAVIALDHDAAVEGEAREDRHRRVLVEQVGVIDRRGTCSVAVLNAGTSMSVSMPKSWRAETLISGMPETFWRAAVVVEAITRVPQYKARQIAG